MHFGNLLATEEKNKERLLGVMSANNQSEEYLQILLNYMEPVLT